MDLRYLLEIFSLIRIDDVKYGHFPENCSALGMYSPVVNDHLGS